MDGATALLHDEFRALREIEQDASVLVRVRTASGAPLEIVIRGPISQALLREIKLACQHETENRADEGTSLLKGGRNRA